MLRRIRVPQADDLQDATIEISGPVPQFSQTETPEEIGEYYLAQARHIETALYNSLPGAIYDRLAGLMLLHLAGLLRVGNPGSGAVNG